MRKMNRKHQIIVGIIILILGFFGTKNYLSIEKEQEKYRKLDGKFKEKQNSTKFNKIETSTKITKSKSPFKGQMLFTYSSDSYDIEFPNGSMITKDELTYHIFDFEKKIVTQSSILNGKRISIDYPFKSMYVEKGMLTTTYVLKVETLGLKEIWWSPDVPNLGYDYDDGKRINIT